MAAELSELRVMVSEVLAGALGLPFLEGRIEGPVRNRALGCVYPVSKAEDEDNVLLAEWRLNVRVFQKWVEQTDPERPPTTAKLEEWADTIQATLSAHQLEGGAWFFRATSIEFDMDTQGIEVQLSARDWNLFGCPPP